MKYINIKDVIIYEVDFEDRAMNKKSNIFTIYGNISCGKFKFIDDNIVGYVEIPKEMIGDGDYFVLRTNGDSMIGCGINDGDLLIVQRQPYAEDGQIAVVMYDNSVTLKRFFAMKKEKKYRLHPENSKYKDIILDECEVLGIAIKIIKDLTGDKEDNRNDI